MACRSCGGTKRAPQVRASSSTIEEPLPGSDGVYRFSADPADCEAYHGMFTGTTVFVIGMGTEYEEIFLRHRRAEAQRLAAAHGLTWLHTSVTALCHDRVVALLGG